MRALITGSSGQNSEPISPWRFQLRGDEVLGIDSRPNSWTDKFATQIVDLHEDRAQSGNVFHLKKKSPDVDRFISPLGAKGVPACSTAAKKHWEKRRDELRRAGDGAES